MSTCRFIGVVGAVVILACGCQSPNRKSRSSEASASATVMQEVSASFTWRIPPDFRTFGSPTSHSIRVAVFGYSVKQGYYYLAGGATVHDAMDAAQFSGFVGWQRPYSGIQRQRLDGSVE